MESEEKLLTSLKNATVRLVAPAAGMPYSRMDFYAAVKSVVGQAAIIGMGQGERNNVWSVTLDSPEARMQLLTADGLTAKDRPIYITGCGKNEYRLVIQCLPIYVPTEMLNERLSGYGLKVLRVQREKTKIDGADIYTGIRTMVVETDDPNKIPHTLPWSYDGEKGEMFVTMKGRSPLCFRCRLVGHTRKECKALYCLKCRKYNAHATEDHPPPTFSEKVKLGSQPNPQQGTMDAEEISLEEVNAEDLPTENTSNPTCANQGTTASEETSPLIPESSVNTESAPTMDTLQITSDNNTGDDRVSTPDNNQLNTGIKPAVGSTVSESWASDCENAPSDESDWCTAGQAEQHRKKRHLPNGVIEAVNFTKRSKGMRPQAKPLKQAKHGTASKNWEAKDFVAGN